MELEQDNSPSKENGSVAEPPLKRKRQNPFLDKKEEKERRRQRRARIIIRNISYKATEESLKKHFEQFGEIVELNLLKRADGKLVGCAFIQYDKINEAAKAILKATNKEFLGRPVYVDWALGKDEFAKKKSDGNEGGDDKKPSEIKEENDEDMEADKDIKSESEDEEAGKSTEDETDEDNKDIKPSVEKKPKHISNDVQEGCTIFIKNVSFDATNDDLRKCCRKYGPIYYAIINTEPISGHSKGTGFVKFKSKESADLCLKAGEEFVLFDNVMETFPALSRSDVQTKLDSTKNKEPTDSRNLYLAKEGLIMAGSTAADGVSASDMAKRHKLEQMKTQILKNLNRFVSKNRLSIHNLPINYDDEKLRNMIIQQTNLKPHECRVMRENKPTAEHPKGKSKGFGFMSFKTHLNALTALRKLNNNPSLFGPQNRPIVAFSIEDRSVLNIKEKRLQKSRDNNPTFKNKIQLLKEKKKNKKQNNKDTKNLVQNEINNNKQKKVKKSMLNKNSDNNIVDDDFVGVPAKPGSFVRMRSNWKIKDQSKEHMKKLKDIKKKEKHRKERLIHRQEKKQIDRTKQNNKIKDKDQFSFLVDKYKRLINSNTKTDIKTIKTKRSKWYKD